jgi:selenocysteine-specific elongation factor
VPGLDRAVGARLEALVAAGRLARRGGSISRPGIDPDAVAPDLAAAMDRLVAALSVVAPPALSAAAAAARCPEDGVRRLERDGRIVRLDADLAWAAPAYAGLEARAIDLARRAPLTPATLRDATGTSRKYVMAILEDLDRRAILRRTPDGHVPGPRADAARTDAARTAAAASRADR